MASISSSADVLLVKLAINVFPWRVAVRMGTLAVKVRVVSSPYSPRTVVSTKLNCPGGKVQVKITSWPKQGLCCPETPFTTRAVKASTAARDNHGLYTIAPHIIIMIVSIYMHGINDNSLIPKRKERLGTRLQ